MITTELFRNSFYYIAPGFDFEPLCRFSNQCNTFLYANLFKEKEVVLEKIQSHFKDNEFLELISLTIFDDFDEARYFELHEDYPIHLARAREWMTAKEQNDYKKIFNEAKSNPQWLVQVDFKSKLLNRVMTLYYFTGEGLASYIALSKNGMYPPKILCTIQTEILENPSGLMHRLFNATKNSPEQWIKGFEPDWGASEKNRSFKKDKIFDVIGMDFQFEWDAKESFYYDYTTLRHVKLYIKKDDELAILMKPFKAFISNKIIYANLFDVYKEPSSSKKIFLVTKHFDRKKFEGNPKNEVLSWEDLLNINKYHDDKISITKTFETLENLSKTAEFDEINFVPYGMEDEGKLLAEFLSRQYPTPLTAVVNRPIDFIDLRV